MILRLNMFPVMMQGSESEHIFRLSRNAALERAWRELPGDIKARASFRPWDDTIWFWAFPDRELPAEFLSAGAEEVELRSVPNQVLANAARDALSWHLHTRYGFERTGGHLEGITRLFRWQHNLLGNLSGVPPHTAGLLPTLAIQGWPLEPLDPEGPRAAVILDLQLRRIIDDDLAGLADLGIHLRDRPLVWHHALGCLCNPRSRGLAGEFRALSPDGSVTVTYRGAQTSRPSMCVRLQPSEQVLAEYLAARTAKTSSDTLTLLRQKATEFHEGSRHWTRLDRARLGVGDFTVFHATNVRLGQALEVTETTSGFTFPTRGPVLQTPSLNFRYGQTLLNSNAALGLRTHGPFDSQVSTRKDRISATIVFPSAFQADAVRLAEALRDGCQGWPGMVRTYRLSGLDITFHGMSGEDLTSYTDAAKAVARSRPDLAFVVTRTDHRYAPFAKNPYLASKAILLANGIQAQAVRLETLRGPSQAMRWTYESIALASYAKIGNLPFALHDPSGVAELIIGVGRSDVYTGSGADEREQLYGTAVSFRQDGDFLYADGTPLTADRDAYAASLAKVLLAHIGRYREATGQELERLIVHVFKRTGEKECAAVKSALAGTHLEFALVHVNRDSPLWIARFDGGGRVGRPSRGTTVQVGDGDYLLATGESARPEPGHALRLTLHPESTFRDMDRLLTQAFALTLTSYRTFRPTIEPSPTLYGRLLAEKVGQLRPYGFSDQQAEVSLSDKPWFI